MYGEGVRIDSLAGNDQVLLVPGLYNSGPGHWQTLWEKEYGFARVEQQDWDAPRCADWVRTLDEVIRAQSVPVVLVAHSLGCIAVAHWAAVHPESADRVHAAMLVAVSDAERPDFPPGVSGFVPIPHAKLPFKSVIVASTNDAYTDWARSEEFAAMWGSELVNAGQCGHITAVDGFGPWPFGLDLLKLLRPNG
jgi:predicted alpha/beta hydrolase family esterase